jgi:hypothetical protein
MRNPIAVLLSATLAAACSGGTQLSLSTRTGAAASTAPTALTKAATGAALTLSNGITIDRLRVVVRTVELERASATPDDNADLQEFEAGPFLLDLSGAALSGTVQQVAVASVPTGTYREVKFEIHKPDASEPGVPANAGLAAMATAQASIIVEGLIDGAPYTFTTGLDVEQKFEGVYNIGSGTPNLTLNLDASTWFGGSGALRLDPRDSAKKSAIETNIKASMKVFDDDDRDGHEDHS